MLKAWSEFVLAFFIHPKELLRLPEASDSSTLSIVDVLRHNKPVYALQCPDTSYQPKHCMKCAKALYSWNVCPYIRACKEQRGAKSEWAVCHPEAVTYLLVSIEDPALAGKEHLGKKIITTNPTWQCFAWSRQSKSTRAGMDRSFAPV